MKDAGEIVKGLPEKWRKEAEKLDYEVRPITAAAKRACAKELEVALTRLSKLTLPSSKTPCISS
jgi:hypothetical protein